MTSRPKIRAFVTVGTALDPFDRLIEHADGVLQSIDAEVTGICQFGRCNARSKVLENVPFLGSTAFLSAVSKADVIFTGGGAGTLSVCIRAGHRPVALARREDLGECVNDHQFELIAALRERGHVIDATRPDIGAFLSNALVGGLRRASLPTHSALPSINFTQRARYSGLRLRAVHLILRWFDPDQMRVR